MTEHDAFEIRFHAAVRSYAGRLTSALDPAELADRIAAREPRRHGFAAALTTRGLAIPGRAWVLLLLAALLTALVAGMLVVGSYPREEFQAVAPPVVPAFACPPGSNPDEPGPVDQARPGGPFTMAFDRRAGRVVALTTSTGGNSATWTFDVCTNTWTRMHPNREPASVDRGRLVLVYDAGANVMVAVAWNTGRAWAYDLQANTWTEKGAAPGGATFWAYDPVSGFVIGADSADPAGLWDYDSTTDAWTPIHQANGPSNVEFAYDASVDRIVGYAGGSIAPETWLLDVRTGTWSTSDAVTPAIVAGWGLPHTIDFDAAAARTVIVSNSGLAAYDATADHWEMLVAGEPGEVPDTMVYDAVNGRLVGAGAGSPDVIGVQADVVAFDLTTREWTVLLEPSGRQAAPSTN